MAGRRKHELTYEEAMKSKWKTRHYYKGVWITNELKMEWITIGTESFDKKYSKLLGFDPSAPRKR